MQREAKGAAEAGKLGASSALVRASIGRLRRRKLTLQLLVLALWGVATFGLAAALTSMSLLSSVMIAAPVNHVLMSFSIYAGMSMTLLAPPAVWAGRVIARRDSAARMALLGADDPILDELSPVLRALIADARLARSAIEGSEQDDEAAVRTVWEWLQRLASLPERERLELEDRGLLGRRVEDTLRWTIDEPGRSEQGLAKIADELGSFERALLAHARGPYR